MVNLDYLYSPAAVKPFFDKNYFADKKLGFQVIEKGTILPHKPLTGSWWGGGGILDSNGNFIRGTWVKSELNGNYPPFRINFPQFSNGHLLWSILSRLGTFPN